MKKNTTWLIIGGAVVLIAGLGFVLLRKPKKNLTEPNQTSEEEKKPEASLVSFELVGFVKNPALQTISVRSMPSFVSDTKKVLESFTTVYARPSSNKGWSEISEDNETVLGYVPNETLRKL
jgi:LPXTG-motif cell wall-anchored protein